MRTLLIAIFATLLLAAPASAARFQHNGDDIDFTTFVTDNVRITATGFETGDPRQLTFTAGQGGSRLTAGTGCSLQNLVVRCGVTDATRLRFTTNERADLIDASRINTPNDASVPQSFDTRGGDDVLIAGPLNDEVRSGAGRDTITGGPGADVLSGEAGDDAVVGLDPGDTVDGGDGTDTLDLSGGVVGQTLVLDGSGGVTSIEAVIGSIGDDVLIGGGAPDSLQGGNGNDRIETRGGGADSVDCGAGVADVAIVDETDSVTGCETVDLPADDTAPPAPTADPVPTVTPAPLAAPATPAAPARLRRTRGNVTFNFTAFPNGRTRVDTLVVRRLQRDGRAELRCTGGCGFRKKVGRARDGKVNLRRLIPGRLRAGATLDVRLSAPGTIARVLRFKMKRGEPPKPKRLCQAPGEGLKRCA